MKYRILKYPFKPVKQPIRSLRLVRHIERMVILPMPASTATWRTAKEQPRHD